MAHREITAWLSKAQKLPDWWAQMVTVGYERARGFACSTRPRKVSMQV